jgi:Xaa-Pro aminopeptidase
VKQAKLIVAASDASADMLYATRFRAPDPFVYLEARGRSSILLSDLEVDRGRRQAMVDEVASYSSVEKEVQGRKKRKPSYLKVLARFLRDRGAQSLLTPGDFPFALGHALAMEGFKVRALEGPIWPARQIKTEEEIALLGAAQRVAEAGMARAYEILKASTSRKDKTLSWGRKILTAELLRAEMEIAVVRAGGEARGDTIVACGELACDPHERGTGPLLADQLIVLDVFPRDARSGYFGDLTRTVVRGAASDAQRKIWDTCLEGQNRALRALKPRATGRKIHEAVKAFFARKGYPTEIRYGRWHGFFHGTGHGLGLEIHERPRFSEAIFQPGEVFTVEPGIYWPGIGGVRHEDVVVITSSGHRLISSFSKQLEI